jgi:hypothetical protein
MSSEFDFRAYKARKTLLHLLQRPLLEDLRVLVHASKTDDPSTFPPEDLVEQIDEVLPELMYHRALLDGMLQHAAKAIPDIKDCLFRDGHEPHPVVLKNPLTFHLAYYLMLLSYVSSASISTDGKSQMVYDLEPYQEGLHDLQVFVKFDMQLLSANLGHMAHFRRHLPAWNLLAEHLGNACQAAAELVRGEPPVRTFIDLSWARFVALVAGHLFDFVQRLLKTFERPAYDAWMGAIARAGAALAQERGAEGATVSALLEHGIKEHLEDKAAWPRKRRVLSRKDLGGGGGGGSAGPGSGAGSHGGRSRGPHRRRLHRSRSRVRAGKVLRGGRGLLRRSRSRARLARGSRAAF